MKLSDVWENIYLWLKYKKPCIITFSVQLVIWIVGGVIIVFLAAKEFYEKRIKK